ncbi:MAG: DoxX family protein [Bacteroidales bacterium]|nr:DoxX family protein [Bacteroidales bacterium]
METDKVKIVPVLKMVLRILLGAFFIATAIMKLLSLDHFELYIFSFQIFNFVLSAIIARLVIAAEMILGFFLIFKILYKPTWWATMLMMGGFTLLLVYVAIFRNDSSCHCMGDLVELNPAWSIVKNLVTIVLLLLIRRETPARFRGWKLVGILGVCAAFVATFVCFPLDGIYNLFKKDKNPYNEEAFHAFMQDSLMRAQELDTGNYIIGVVASGCKYCKISAEKLQAISERNRLDDSRILLTIWGKEESLAEFEEITGDSEFRYVTISPIQAVQLVNGRFPTYLFVHNGQVVQTADLRQLTERGVVDFIPQQKQASSHE